MSTWPDDEDDLDEAEDPDESDQDSDEESGTAPCPHCGEDVYEEADRCPNCGQYITPSAAASPARPKWFIIAVILALLAVLLWLI